MKMPFAVFMTSWILGSSHLGAVTVDNLVSCEDHVSGWVNCRVATNTLDTLVYPFDMSFTVKYQYLCGLDIYLQISSGDNKVNIPPSIESKEEKSITINGRGPLIISDSDPKWTRMGIANRGCTFKIIGVEKSYSQEAQTILDSLQNTLSDIDNNATKKQVEAIKYHSYFASDAGGKEVFFCLISSYNDPLLYDEGLLKDLKNTYQKQYDEEFVPGKYECPAKMDIHDVSAQCEEDPLSDRACLSYSAYKNARNWFISKLNDLNNQTQFAIDDQVKNSLEKAKEDLTKLLGSVSAI